MFTGIVQTQGSIRAIDQHAGGLRLVVDAGDWGVKPQHGESICVSGVCLTVVDHCGAFAFDVIQETLDKTTLGGLKVGDAVNLEPSVTPSQPMGGHFVQGHVDGVGEVVEVIDTSQEWRTVVRPPAELMAFMIPKGSVTIEGVSLTLAAVHAETVEVALIPTTLELTTLAERKAGDRVNLEADILAKTIVHTLQRMQGSPEEAGVTTDLLQRAGFA